MSLLSVNSLVTSYGDVMYTTCQSMRQAVSRSSCISVCSRAFLVATNVLFLVCYLHPSHSVAYCERCYGLMRCMLNSQIPYREVIIYHLASRTTHIIPSLCEDLLECCSSVSLVTRRPKGQRTRSRGNISLRKRICRNNRTVELTSFKLSGFIQYVA